MGKQWIQWQILFSWAPKSLWTVTAAMKLKDTCSLEGIYDKCWWHIKKQRHHFANKDLYSQSYGFSSSQVQMWELDHKEAECQRIDAFELQHWIGLLRVLWTAGRSNQSILKEINSEYSLGLMLKLKLQYFNYLMLRANSLEKPLMLGKIEAGGEGGNRLTDDEIVGQHHWLNGHEFEQTGR